MVQVADPECMMSGPSITGADRVLILEPGAIPVRAGDEIRPQSGTMTKLACTRTPHAPPWRTITIADVFGRRDRERMQPTMNAFLALLDEHPRPARGALRGRRLVRHRR